MQTNSWLMATALLILGVALNTLFRALILIWRIVPGPGLQKLNIEENLSSDVRRYSSKQREEICDVNTNKEAAHMGKFKLGDRVAVYDGDMSSFYAKVIYDNDGVVEEHEYPSKELAQAFCRGFVAAREITKEGDTDELEDYYACVDTEPAKEVE